MSTARQEHEQIMSRESIDRLSRLPPELLVDIFHIVAVQQGGEDGRRYPTALIVGLSRSLYPFQLEGLLYDVRIQTIESFRRFVVRPWLLERVGYLVRILQFDVPLFASNRSCFDAGISAILPLLPNLISLRMGKHDLATMHFLTILELKPIETLQVVSYGGDFLQALTFQASLLTKLRRLILHLKADPACAILGHEPEKSKKARRLEEVELSGRGASIINFLREAKITTSFKFSNLTYDPADILSLLDSEVQSIELERPSGWNNALARLSALQFGRFTNIDTLILTAGFDFSPTFFTDLFSASASTSSIRRCIIRCRFGVPAADLIQALSISSSAQHLREHRLDNLLDPATGMLMYTSSFTYEQVHRVVQLAKGRGIVMDGVMETAIERDLTWRAMFAGVSLSG